MDEARAEHIEQRYRMGVISLQQAAAEYMTLFREAMQQFDALCDRVAFLEEELDKMKQERK